MINDDWNDEIVAAGFVVLRRGEYKDKKNIF